MLSARELNSDIAAEPHVDQQRLTFTHGYGLTLGPVNEVTPEGLPVLFIRDLPLSSSVDLQVAQPADLFRRAVERPRVRRDRHAGVRLSAWRRERIRHLRRQGRRRGRRAAAPAACSAIRFASTETLFSPKITADSRVLMYRRIAERVRRIAPFLTYDRDPYLAISDGRLVWVQDAYTTSAAIRIRRRAPRAQLHPQFREGHDRCVSTARSPSICSTRRIRSPRRLREGVSRSCSSRSCAMPEDLRTRLRYPQGIFALQAAMFATFHMTQPGDLLQPRGPVGRARARSGPERSARWRRTTRS